MQSCASNFPPPHARLGYFSRVLLQRTSHNRAHSQLHTLSLKDTFNFWLKKKKKASQRAIETGTPNPTSVQPEHLDPFSSAFLFSIFRWKEEAGGSLYLPASQYQPLSGAQERVVERFVLPLEAANASRAASPVSGKAVAIAAIVASALTAAAAAAAAFTVGGCRESTVMTVGSAQLLRRQVPWIRKLGQAPRIGGEGCARANQLPPRAPVSLRRTRGAAGPQEQSGWRPRPRPLTPARSHSHTHSHTPGAGTWLP